MLLIAFKDNPRSFQNEHFMFIRMAMSRREPPRLHFKLPHCKIRRLLVRTD